MPRMIRCMVGLTDRMSIAVDNYRDLLHDVTISPSMGKYLDLANSMKPGLGGGANENFTRELMQLFTIGLWQLNNDGSRVLDGNGNPIPTYDQATVAQVALALTGWTYATAPGATPQSANNEYFGAPMETRPANHDTSSKVIIGEAGIFLGFGKLNGADASSNIALGGRSFSMALISCSRSSGMRARRARGTRSSFASRSLRPSGPASR